MFLIDKYAPKNIKDSIFHKDLLDFLSFISKDESIPHMIFYGPEGSGKKRIIKLFLQMIYDNTINKLEETPYTVIGSGNKTNEIMVKQSNYHIVIDPHNNNFDKYLIQDIVKKYANIKQLNIYKKNFKVVLINNVDNLSYYAQTSLRRTMEKYSGNCRFIMWCRSLSRIIDPLKSRCTSIRVSCPKDEDMFKFCYKVSMNERLSLNMIDYTNIITRANGNIKKMLWMLEMKKANLQFETAYDETITQIVELIKNVKIEEITEIRNLLYNILITNIDGTTIIKDIIIRLCKDETIPDNKKYKMIDNAAKFEHNLIRNRREIIHLEALIMSIFEILTKK